MAQDLIAIDVLLEPDPRMLARAEADNARLRAMFPGGFALDAQHSPHITLLQAFVPTGSLAALTDAVGSVIASTRPHRMELHAERFGYTPGPGMGIAGIWVAVAPALAKLQADVIAAASPFLAPTGDIDAFTEGHGNPAFDAALIDYVTHFTSKGAGAHFEPHVSTGVAPTATLDAMMSEPFAPFTFACPTAALYQLGPFGTAARLLHRWEVAP